jgi:hypothetical protein
MKPNCFSEIRGEQNIIYSIDFAHYQFISAEDNIGFIVWSALVYETEGK